MSADLQRATRAARWSRRCFKEGFLFLLLALCCHRGRFQEKRARLSRGDVLNVTQTREGAFVYTVSLPEVYGLTALGLWNAIMYMVTDDCVNTSVQNKTGLKPGGGLKGRMQGLLKVTSFHFAACLNASNRNHRPVEEVKLNF